METREERDPERLEEDPQRLADELERQSDELGQRSEALEERVREVRSDWDRKRADPSVPGAMPDDRVDAQKDAAGEPQKEAETESPADEAPSQDAGEDK
jgi:hypothetical protein